MLGAMEVTFASGYLDRLEVDPSSSMGLPQDVVKMYRKRLQGIRSAEDERDFRAFKSWRFEKLKGKRQHQYSMRLNDQFRLVLELGGGKGDKRVTIVGVEDYH